MSSRMEAIVAAVRAAALSIGHAQQMRFELELELGEICARDRTPRLNTEQTLKLMTLVVLAEKMGDSHIPMIVAAHTDRDEFSWSEIRVRVVYARLMTHAPMRNVMNQIGTNDEPIVARDLAPMDMHEREELWRRMCDALLEIGTFANSHDREANMQVRHMMSVALALGLNFECGPVSMHDFLAADNPAAFGRFLHEIYDELPDESDLTGRDAWYENLLATNPILQALWGRALAI